MYGKRARAMYVIKRGEDIFRKEDVCDLVNCILDMWFKKYMEIDDIDVAHLRLILVADTYVRWHVYPTPYLLKKNLIPLAAKYGLTIEEVKDV